MRKVPRIVEVIYWVRFLKNYDKGIKEICNENAKDFS